MIIKIRLFTVLRELASKREETLNFEEKTVNVKQALDALSKKYGKPFDDYVFEADGKVKGFLQFLINGTNTSTLLGLETQFSDGDVLTILPPVGGG
ncbi:MAG: ubiquitin-like small modifier protein 1 [Candidatus Bathyarchaeia archaeon]|jgi:MoaD family protein